MSFCISNKFADGSGKYAGEELRYILGLLPEKEIPGGLSFYIGDDAGLSEYAYSVRAEKGRTELLGRTSDEALLAVYLFLERIGFSFDTSGIHAPKKPDFGICRDYSETVEPFVRLRGIRQHINFPMDISSYRIEDAEEYIRSLARMRLNAITFHSYDGMWTGDPGHFFYNTIHDIPDDGFVKGKIDNSAKYVSPECERLLGDSVAVSEFAVGFLRRIIHTAKTAGMHVTLSIEPNSDPKCVSDAVNLYPEIDEIELISPEYGTFGGEPEIPAGEAVSMAVELFGEDILDGEGNLPGLDKNGVAPPKFSDTVQALAIAVNHYRNRDKIYKASRELPIRVGLYVLDCGSVYIGKRIMDKVLPEDVIRTFLPAHGAEAVIDVVKYMGFSPKDFQNTVLYSWIEFDGNMYIQQNSATAVYHTFDYLRELVGAGSVCSVCFNHWRTAENRLPIAYSAAAAERIVTPDEFFGGFAARHGLDPKIFSEIMWRAGELDTYCRDRLFNIGFCFLFCWKLGDGITWCMPYEEEALSHAAEECGEIISLLSRCVSGASDEDGVGVTDLLRNRYDTTIVHLAMISAILEIRPLCGTSNKGLTAEMREKIGEILDRASVYVGCYGEKYSCLMPDRGCEGQLVDYLVTMRGYIAYLRKFYLGAETDRDGSKKAEYAPPPPGIISAKESEKR